MGERRALVLGGCRPEPLASYLKALGIFRLVAEQLDPQARASWQEDRFLLHTHFQEEEIVDFFANNYVPTPIVTPWNGGSGFGPKDNKSAITALADSKATRFRPYREVIALAYSFRERLGITEKPEDRKEELLQLCRAAMPDEVVAWLDAAYVIVDGKAQYPPILGTGGNDGRLEFARNFMERVVELLPVNGATPSGLSTVLLASAVFGHNVPGLGSASIGQFMPGSAGGANAATGFDGASVVNPWDYVLMMEGSLLFAAAAVRRLESADRGTLAAPFTVRASAAGYGSASSGESSRGEIWLPLWTEAATIGTLRLMFGEGRVRLERRRVRDGVDFARAVASLGVDRGIRAFSRQGFHVRNGLAYLATPLGRFLVQRRPEVDLLRDLDAWLDTCGSKVRSGDAPASVQRSARNLDEAIFALCRGSGSRPVLDLLVKMGELEAALVKSRAWSEKSFVRPLPPPSPSWLRHADDGSPEWRLAVALASVHVEGAKCPPFHRHLEPTVRVGKGRRAWFDKEGELDLTWHDGDPVSAMLETLGRRLHLQGGEGAYVDQGHCAAYLSDVTAFVEGALDLRRFGCYLRACALFDWREAGNPKLTPPEGAGREHPGALFALLKLCFMGRVRVQEGGLAGLTVPLSPQIFHNAARGEGLQASRLAVRRLRGVGLSPALEQVGVSGAAVQRAAAALLFPLRPCDLNTLAEIVVLASDDDR